MFWGANGNLMEGRTMKEHQNQVDAVKYLSSVIRRWQLDQEPISELSIKIDGKCNHKR